MSVEDRFPLSSQRLQHWHHKALCSEGVARKSWQGDMGPGETRGTADPLLPSLSGCVSIRSELWHWWFLAQAPPAAFHLKTLSWLVAWTSPVRTLERRKARLLWQMAPKGQLVSPYVTVRCEEQFLGDMETLCRSHCVRANITATTDPLTSCFWPFVTALMKLFSLATHF